MRGTPENAPIATVGFSYAIDGVSYYFAQVPVQYKHTDPALGELYQPLVVVPPVMVNIPAARACVFADAQPKTIPVTLRRRARRGVGPLALQVPAGWQAEPATAAFELKNKDDEQTVSFTLQPGPRGPRGQGRSARRGHGGWPGPTPVASRPLITRTSPPKRCSPRPWRRW
ncbi:MAG: hypothetical protein WKG07_34025 [Hymenobacter sp.]